MSSRKILFIDDDPGVMKTAEFLLRKAGYAFIGASNPAEAYSVLAAESVDAILLDLNFSRAQMLGDEGLVCLREILRYDPRAVVIIVTGHSGLNVAVQALRSGAQNFIMKPWNNERLLDAIEEGIAHRRNVEAQTKDTDFVANLDTSLIVGECDAILRTKELIGKYAPLTATVLLIGEVGTGKSLVAQALHRQSLRADLKFIEASSLSVDDLTYIENTTLVLENIDGLDPALTQPVTTWLQGLIRHNTRIVATTCRQHPDIGIQKSLLYALSTLEITLTPLRDRGNDIELLSNHFARVFTLRQGLEARTFAPEAIVALRASQWQDNLHALRRVVERAIAGASGTVVGAADLDLPNSDFTPALNLGLNLERTEKFVIEEALSRNNFNISQAASELGLTRQTLYRRMARHGL